MRPFNETLQMDITFRGELFGTSGAACSPGLAGFATRTRPPGDPRGPRRFERAPGSGDRVGEPVDLVEAGGGRVHVELGHADSLEGPQRVADGLLGGQHAVGDHLGVPAEEPVVVLQVLRALTGGLVAEGEVGQRPQPRLALATGFLPGGAHPLQHRRRPVGAASAEPLTGWPAQAWCNSSSSASRSRPRVCSERSVASKSSPRPPTAIPSVNLPPEMAATVALVLASSTGV